MKTSASPAREVALRVLRQVEEKGAYANHLLEIEFARKDLSRPDRKLAYLLAYGVLRHRNRLDWVISRHSDYPIEHLTPWVRNGLRMGVYQLIDMPGLRPYVAINESVRLIHKYGHRGTVALVNAILRKIASGYQHHIPTLEEDPEEHLVIAHSHPRWLVKRWLKQYGPYIATRICSANNIPPPLSIRWNRLKTGNPDQTAPLRVWQSLLDHPEPSQVMPEGLIIRGPRPITEHALYGRGMIDLQAISSMLMPHLLEVKPGERVLDVCAGSGGKSCHMADLMENQGQILCVDHSESKLKALCNRAERLGVKICHAVCGKSDKEAPWKDALFDKILVDAPCSSLGIIRRHPEIRWLRKEEDINTLARTQEKILVNAARALKCGGRLLYCTCSLEPEETGDIMQDFLKNHPHFKIVSINKNVPRKWQDTAGEKGAVRLMPFLAEADGFFAFSVTKYI